MASPRVPHPRQPLRAAAAGAVSAAALVAAGLGTAPSKPFGVDLELFSTINR
ncbi:hypothetical protein AB0I22_09330 [Streptomyces sp. NPDC050610]|uniref:hypothetical protein n=1 Tax=Streptomyces sp. NPDC050610 TaxID=3157097 RepID=UPI00342EE2B9